MKSNKNNSCEIGKRIAGLREQAGLTQAKLAKQLFIKRETVNQWENGARQIKGADIADLADALNTTCDYILRGISTKNVEVFKITGLTEDSINFLIALQENQGGGGDRCRKALGALLSESRYSECYDFWERIGVFLFNSDNTFKAILETGEREFTAEDVLSILLSENEQLLRKLRRENLKRG